MENIYTQMREVQDGYRNWATLSIYYGMCALVLVAAGVFLLRGDWEAALSTGLVFFLMLVPSIVKGRYRLYLPFALDLGIVGFTFLTLFLGGVAHFYDRIPFWDKFLHLQSGLLLGAAGYVLLYILNENKRMPLNLSPGFVSLFAVTFSLAIGVVWEVSEFFGDAVFGSSWQPSSVDTMWDLIADGAGALITSIAGYFWMYRYKRLPFTPWLFLKEKLRGAAGQRPDVLEESGSSRFRA
ncbi:MAG: hypothetical protein AAB665_00115 [Patescibacteria group bacterium]